MNWPEIIILKMIEIKKRKKKIKRHPRSSYSFFQNKLTVQMPYGTFSKYNTTKKKNFKKSKLDKLFSTK